MANAKTVITLSALLGPWFQVAGQQMVDKYLWEFDTLGVSGHPNDAFNDHQAFVDAAAFFQARHGYGRLLLEDGEYIMGVQQLRNVNDPSPGPGWDDFRYPTGALSAPNCKSLVASQNGFLLDSCFNFTIQGGTNTSVRYRDCLYYGTFLRDSITGEVFSAVGVTDTIVLDTLQQDTIEVQRCMTCLDSLILPQWLNIPLRHAAVGTMFTFTYCDSVAVRNVELNGNIDAAILGGKAAFDGMQTAYDGVNLWASSRCLIENVHAHHFGRDGLMLAGYAYTDTVTPFADAYPGLHVSTDTADNNDTILTNRTVLFDNQVLGSQFHWNGRQGFSWTGLAGLTMSDCELNYNGAGRLSSSPGSGMDIEGIGGPMRVRHGVFTDCRYLHNQNGGVVTSPAACLGQQFFTFTNCTLKAGSEGSALWASSRGMRFYDCQIYGQVERMFEQAEDLQPRNPDFDLLFRNTNFYEEDDDWSYLKEDTSNCAGGPHKLDLINSGRSNVTFDTCGFFTNCHGLVRLKGRRSDGTTFPWCGPCTGGVGGVDCDCQGSECSDQDARYITVTNCTFVNTGRERCTGQTQLLGVDYATVNGFTINIPDSVRNGQPNDIYTYPFGNDLPSCYPLYCDSPTVILTHYGNNFPPCLPFFTDTAATWVYCSAEDLPTTPCGELLLTKTATPDVAFIDSSVTFTITVCNNTVFATPLLLSEQLPPSFTVTGVSPAWSLADTSLTLDNGHCAVFEITGHFTAFGDFTNSVTLDPDTTATGDELSADADVSVVSTCAANIVIPDSALASVVGTVFSGTVNIQGLFFVDDDVLFQNAQVFMEAGAEIIVQNGSTLDIENSSFTACNGVMWRSITAGNGATVRIWDSFMDDAESLVSALDGSALWVDGTQFHNNRVAISIPDSGGTYNSVACWVSNSTFYSAGPMPLPYPGQGTAVGAQGYAAVDVHKTTLEFTGGNNIIHSLSNGLVGHRSDMTISDCRFLNIQPDAAYTLAGNGAAIYANGSGSYSYLKQTGYGTTGTPSFEGCRWGIYTEYMNVYSTDNHMTGMGTAYRVERSGYREVDILNNEVYTHFHGMELRSNDGAAHILVQYNDITFGDAECTLCRGYSAILVTEGNYVAPDSRILNNTIHFMNAPNSRFGIALTAADAWLVAGNMLWMVDNANNRTGVQLQGCRRTEVSCNAISSSATSYPIAAQAAIRNMMGSDVLISCNEMDKTANGILFNFVAPNSEVRGNFFHNHKWALHLDSTAIIGPQSMKGNLWYNQPAAGGFGAWYEHLNNATANPFEYNAAIISGGNTQPPTTVPPGWFIGIGGVNYDYADHHGVQYCLLFGGERCQGCLGGLDEKIASDSLENDPYTIETKWILKGDLYKRLDDTPALLDSLPILEDFYDEFQGSARAAFKAIDDDQLLLYDLDSAIVEQLHANRTQVEILLELVSAGLEQLGDSALTPVQRQAILISLSGYREDIRDLCIWNSNTLQVATSSKAVSANNVQTTNSGIGSSELIEENQKSVNDIYLATIGKDVDMFTANQTAALLGIAGQCPMVGGNAVFKARSLYWLIDDTHEFDDALLCVPHGIIVKRLTEQLGGKVSVVPNPASDEATLVLDHNLKEPFVFVVFDALGTEVLRHALPTERSRFAFSTASLAPALYHYQVRGPSGTIGDGKITIVR